MDEQLLATLKALADASRLAIVGLLAKHPRSVDELAAALGLSASTISQHLGKLAQAGLVEMRSEQYYNIYSLKPEALESLGKRVIAADRDETLTTSTDEAAYERDVIKKHVRPNGVAMGWPTGLQKQRVLLRWLGETRFKRGERYTEPQVHDIICQGIQPSPDTNSLRRYLISEKVLARTSNGSWYWRTDTPEAQRPGFLFERLQPAVHEFSPAGIALLLRGKGKLSHTRAVLDARMRELDVRDLDAMRVRMVRLEWLSPSEDGSTWTVTDPRKIALARDTQVKKRFMVDGKIQALPDGPADRRLVLRWFAGLLDRGRLYTDAQLNQLLRHLFANVPALKTQLLAEGLLMQARDNEVALFDSFEDQ